MARLEIEDYNELEEKRRPEAGRSAKNDMKTGGAPDPAASIGLEREEAAENDIEPEEEPDFASSPPLEVESPVKGEMLSDGEAALQERLAAELQRKRERRSRRPMQRNLRLGLAAAVLLCLLLFAGLSLRAGKLRRLTQDGRQTASASVVNETESEESMESGPSEEELRVQEAIASYTNLGIVQCNSYINLRSAPDQRDLSNIRGMLRNGAAVEILEENVEGAAGWMYVRSGGMEGYVAGSYLLRGEEAAAAVPGLIRLRATVLADKLRLRSAPELTDGNTIGSAAKGERYEVLEQVGTDWVRVRTDNLDSAEDAYMSALPENTRLSYGLDEARSLDLRRKVLNSYDRLGVSKAADYVNIRKTKDTSGIGNIIGKFPGYAAANILGEEDGWYRISSGKVTGYVKADFIATGKEAEQLAVNHASVMAIVNTDALNVRAEPTTDSAAWTRIVRDQRYNVINQLDGWVQLDLDTGDDEDSEQGAYVSTRDRNVTVMYALQEAIEYYPAVEAANAAMARRNEIVNFACQFVGNPYVWGGTSLTKGADCSGFVLSVLRHFNISVPRTSRAQAGSGRKVTSETMKPGDLVFYANRSGRINHVGIYIGNGQVVNAASRRSGIKIARWNYRTPVAIRNVID